MYKAFHKLLAANLTAALMAGGPFLGSCSAMPPIMPVNEIHSGMVGTGYTVFDNSGQIDSFRVDIFGPINEGKGSTSYIMAKASGAAIESAGGVLQGMSGSPIYVGGRLVGALSIGYQGVPYSFFITPIEEMTKLWDMPDTKNKTRLQQVDIKKAAEERAKRQAEAEKKEKGAATAGDAKPKDAGQATALPEAGTVEAKPTDAAAEDAKPKDAGQEAALPETGTAEAKPTSAAAEENDAATDKAIAEAAADKQTATAEINADKQAATAEATAAAGATQAKSALFFSGFDSAALGFMKQQLGPFGISECYSFDAPRFGAATGYTNYDATLEPGSPLGVAMVYGDFTVGAIGTVTAVDGKRVLAMGHSFLHKGNVNYFMTDASVVGPMGSSTMVGMRFANFGPIIGRVNQDREAGISGVLGQFPSVVPVKVHVKDNGMNRDDTFTMELAYDESMLPLLSSGVTYAALNRVSDTLGENTATVDFAIRTNALDSGKVERSNMFYSPSDVGQVAITELGQAMNIICLNTDEESDIIDLQVDITVESGRKTATIISAVPDKAKVKPGDTVQFKTTIKPYRQKEEVLTIPYKVPATQHSGQLSLDVRGGSLVPVTQLMLMQQSGLEVPTESGEPQRTTADKLKDFMAAGKSNEIVIAPAPPTTLMSEKEQERAIREAVRASQAIQNGGKAKKVNLLGVNKTDSDTDSPEAKLATKYIIENVIHTSIEVERN